LLSAFETQRTDAGSGQSQSESSKKNLDWWRIDKKREGPVIAQTIPGQEKKWGTKPMSKSHTDDGKSKTAPLKLAQGKVRPILRLGGIEACKVEPGRYRMACQGAGADEKGKPMLLFRMIDPPHAGTALRKWLNISHVIGEIRPGSSYAKLCELAVGRELEPDESLEPNDIFRGKIFLAFVGWRKTDKHRGGQFRDDNALHRKDDRDFLRVHELIEVIEL